MNPSLQLEYEQIKSKVELFKSTCFKNDVGASCLLSSYIMKEHFLSLGYKCEIMDGYISAFDMYTVHYWLKIYLTDTIIKYFDCVPDLLFLTKGIEIKKHFSSEIPNLPTIQDTQEEFEELNHLLIGYEILKIDVKLFFKYIKKTQIGIN